MSLRVRLLLAMGYVLLVAIVAFVVPQAVNTSDRVDSEVRAQATAQADLLAVAAAEEEAEGRSTLTPLVEASAAAVVGRVVVVDEQGLLLADSEGEQTGADFSSRPEIQSALAGERVQSERDSQSLGIRIIATAAPMVINDTVVGAIRITQSGAAKGRATRAAISRLALVAAIVLAIGLIAAIIVAGQLTGPIRRLIESTGRLASGDLQERAPVEGSSEQRALARSFNEMTARLGRALGAQREFVADASHQLRTPLTGVRLRLEEAQASLENVSTAEAQSAGDELTAATVELDRLTRIVDEMLVLSRAGETDAPAREVSLDELADRAGSRWEPKADEFGIALRRDGNESGSARCSPEDGDRVLDALIENSLAYSPRGSVVEVATAPGVIEVLDQGPGLQMGEETAVFERFHRGEAGRRRGGGSGLGLPIARGLARGWGGEVSLRNRDPQGTVATVIFKATTDIAPNGAQAP